MIVLGETWLCDNWRRDWREKFLAFVIAHKYEVAWDWGEISANPNVDLSLMQLNPSLPWEWPRLSENENVTVEIVRKNLDKPWDFFALSSNPSFSISDIDELGSWRWSYPYLSSNPSIHIEDVIARPERSWDYTWLSSNRSIDYHSVVNHPDVKWDFRELSRNANLTMEIVKEHPDEAWDYQGLSMNESIGWKEVTENINSPWDWSALSARLPISREVIEKFGEKMSFRHVSENPHITPDIILEFPLKNWDWLRLSSVLPVSVIEEHPHPDLISGFWKWDWYHVSSNRSLSWEFVDRHPSAPWSFFALSQNTQPVAREEYLRRREAAFLAGEDAECPNQKLAVHAQLKAAFALCPRPYTPGDGPSEDVQAAAAVLDKICKYASSFSAPSSSTSAAEEGEIVPFRDALEIPATSAT